MLRGHFLRNQMGQVQKTCSKIPQSTFDPWPRGTYSNKAVLALGPNKEGERGSLRCHVTFL